MSRFDELHRFFGIKASKVSGRTRLHLYRETFLGTVFGHWHPVSGFALGIQTTSFTASVTANSSFTQPLAATVRVLREKES